MYCCVTATLLIGAISDRGRTIPALIFLFIWATVVYNPIACWSWNANGWAARLGYLDYAGGAPVHITAGFGALAYAWIMGKRVGLIALEEQDKEATEHNKHGKKQLIGRAWEAIKGRKNISTKLKHDGHTRFDQEAHSNDPHDLEKGKKMLFQESLLALNSSPHSVMLVVIGTAFMWIGWTGFNGGASIIPTIRSIQAILNTHVSASFGGLTWMLMDYRIGHKWSVIGLCSGIVSGLVCITPAAGYVPGWSSVVFGIVGALIGNVSTKIKFWVGVDDSLDIFAVHGICGVVGNILTAIFASKNVAMLDGITDIDGGWLNRHYVQLWFQIAGTLAAAAYAFGVSAIILTIMNKIPGLKLRIDATLEVDDGLDAAEHDEFAYDYVEIIRDLPLAVDQMLPGHHIVMRGDQRQFATDDSYEYHRYDTTSGNISEACMNPVPPNRNGLFESKGNEGVVNELGRDNGVLVPHSIQSSGTGGNKQKQLHKHIPKMIDIGGSPSNYVSAVNSFRRDSRMSVATDPKTPGLLDETDTVHIECFTPDATETDIRDSEIPNDNNELDPDDPLYRPLHTAPGSIYAGAVHPPPMIRADSNPIMPMREPHGFPSGAITPTRALKMVASNITPFRAHRMMIRSYSSNDVSDSIPQPNHRSIGAWSDFTGGNGFRRADSYKYDAEFKEVPGMEGEEDPGRVVATQELGQRSRFRGIDVAPSIVPRAQFNRQPSIKNEASSSSLTSEFQQKGLLDQESVVDDDMPGILDNDDVSI